jgi:hypothetical protein
MKKALAMSLMISMILMPALAVIPANAGIGTSSYRVFYAHEYTLDVDGNNDMDKLDTLVVLYDDSTGGFTYIGEGVEPEISGSYVMWHSSDDTKLYVYHIQSSSPFMPYWVREYTDDAELHGSGIAFNTLEVYAGLTGQDVNSDGDYSDNVVAYMSLTGFPASPPSVTYWTGEKTDRGGYDGDTITYVKYEAQEGATGTDFNDDTDKVDSVIYYVQPMTSYLEKFAKRYSQCTEALDKNQGTYPRVGGNAIVWTTSEDKDDCDWNGQNGKNDWVVATYDIFGQTTYLVEVTQESYEGHHYVDNGVFVYEINAWISNAGSQTKYSTPGGTKYFVFLGEPIKITGNYIQGYVSEEYLGVDLNGDSDGNDKAMWIYYRTNGRTEILQGGDKYWR